MNIKKIDKHKSYESFTDRRCKPDIENLLQ